MDRLKIVIIGFCSVIFVFSTTNFALAGFGISPPYVHNDNTLGVGDRYVQNITVMRTEDGNEDKVAVSLEVPAIASWFKLSRGNSFSFSKGESKTIMPVSVDVPIDAVPGHYLGKINLKIGQGTTNESGNKIMLGGRIDIDLTVIERQVIDTKNFALYDKLRGRIVFKTGDRGKAYYVHPNNKKIYYLGNHANVLKTIKEQSIGFSERNMEKISIGKNEYLPIKNNEKINAEVDFANKFKGKILLRVQKDGEAWYVSPADGKRYFLGRPEDISKVVKKVGVGISNADFMVLIKGSPVE